LIKSTEKTKEERFILVCGFRDFNPVAGGSYGRGSLLALQQPGNRERKGL
jgi:hypothetical protein